MSSDPYKAGLVGTDLIAAKKDVEGSLVVVLRGSLEDRGLNLTDSVTRALLAGEIHELIVTDEPTARPGSRVDRIAYIGFVEITSGGVIAVGDRLVCAGVSIGTIAGYDTTHLPNHMNIVATASRRTDGTDSGLALGDEVLIGGIGHDNGLEA